MTCISNLYRYSIEQTFSGNIRFKGAAHVQVQVQVLYMDMDCLCTCTCTCTCTDMHSVHVYSTCTALSTVYTLNRPLTSTLLVLWATATTDRWLVRCERRHKERQGWSPPWRQWAASVLDQHTAPWQQCIFILDFRVGKILEPFFSFPQSYTNR